MTRRFNRNLAICAREMVPPELLVEFAYAILEGVNPVLVRTKTSWKWKPSDHGGAPSITDKQWAMTFLRQAGWGMPAQSLHLEADIRSQQLTLDASVDVRALAGLTHEARRGILDLILQGQIADRPRPELTQGDSSPAQDLNSTELRGPDPE